MALLFESVACTRCGGTGQYSWNAMSGSRCFKCQGAKETLTKRGAAAQAYLNGLRQRAAADVVVGDKILNEGVPGMVKSTWVEVTSVGTDGDRVVLGWVGGLSHLFPADTVRMYETAEQKVANREAALAYQATLTKSGTPRKVAVR